MLTTAAGRIAVSVRVPSDASRGSEISIRRIECVGQLVHMEYMWNAKFIHNGVVRRASPTFQLQYLLCLVQGPLQYPQSLTVCSSNAAETLEAALADYEKQIFRLPSNGATELVSATARLAPWSALHAQHHERLYQQLLRTPWQQSYAARVFRLARAEVFQCPLAIG